MKGTEQAFPDEVYRMDFGGENEMEAGKRGKDIELIYLMNFFDGRRYLIRIYTISIGLNTLTY